LGGLNLLKFLLERRGIDLHLHNLFTQDGLGVLLLDFSLQVDEVFILIFLVVLLSGAIISTVVIGEEGTVAHPATHVNGFLLDHVLLRADLLLDELGFREFFFNFEYVILLRRYSFLGRFLPRDFDYLLDDRLNRLGGCCRG